MSDPSTKLLATSDGKWYQFKEGLIYLFLEKSYPYADTYEAKNGRLVEANTLACTKIKAE